VPDAKFVIGIDTGGTYTDAVILDENAERSSGVIASAKALTTKGDLSIGVGEALRDVLCRSGITASQIGLLTVSTTLATNAVVEGHGDRVAVVLIGFDDAMASRTGISTAFPDLPIVRIAGGHNSSGHQISELDEQALRDAFSDSDVVVSTQVSAVAVSSIFSVRNPDHERRAANIIRSLTDLPVTESVDLSTSLDAPRRASTAVLNARLIGKVSALVDAVERSMSALDLVCPLMVVKGDGSRTLASTVRRAPIETIMSGPAASTVGAAWLSRLADFVMSDIGGTTTDTSVVVGGRPRLSPDGAVVGGWRTMVPAIDVRTVGLGGDSRVTIAHRSDGRSISLGPDRVVPLALLASVEPKVLGLLHADLSENPMPENAGRFLALPFGTPMPSTAMPSTAMPSTAMQSPQRVGDRSTGLGVSHSDQQILEGLADGPLPWRSVVVTARVGRCVERMRQAGLLVESSLTPSDVAHALGQQALWSKEAADFGVAIAAAKAMVKVDPFHLAREVWDATVSASTRAIIETCLPTEPSVGFTTTDSDLIEHIATGSTSPFGFLNVSLGPSVALVAVGGPAQLFYPEVAERLACTLHSPPFAQVANAVGAAVGVIMRVQTVTVTRDEVAGFVASSIKSLVSFSSSERAIDWARIQAEEVARTGVVDQGGDPYQCTVDVVRTYLPGRHDDDALLSATIRAEAIGTPSLG
jgi:N-methylhydantoinase A/oxoprolinase/acetone carboxylase beta subunit